VRYSEFTIRTDVALEAAHLKIYGRARACVERRRKARDRRRRRTLAGADEWRRLVADAWWQCRVTVAMAMPMVMVVVVAGGGDIW